MEASFIVLAVGVLLSFWDVLFGRRRWQGATDTLAQRASHAWAERRLTVIGSLFVIASVVLEASGH
jgi:hypothetical protein